MSLKNYATGKPNIGKVMGYSLLITLGVAGILTGASEFRDKKRFPEYYEKRKEFREERNFKIDSIKDIYSRKLDSLAHADYFKDLESLTN